MVFIVSVKNTIRIFTFINYDFKKDFSNHLAIRASYV